MTKRNLLIIRQVIVQSLSKLNIDEVDCTEALINLYHFLDPTNYENNIELLRKDTEEKKGKTYGKSI